MGWRNIHHANGSEKKKKGRVAIVTSDKIDFKTTTITRDRASHNEKGIGPTRRCNTCKYLYTQHWST